VLHKRWTFIQPDVRNCGKGILKMKKILSFVLMMCVLMTIPMFAFAAVSGDEPLTIGTPFMITNAGQGPGGKMGRLLVSRAGTLTEDEDFYYVDVPYAADVDARDYSAIVIVIGCVSPIDIVWNIADTFNGLMAIPNFIALFALSGVVAKLTKEYFADKTKLKQ
jgi:hypothetical protein